MLPIRLISPDTEKQFSPARELLLCIRLRAIAMARFPFCNSVFRFPYPGLSFAFFGTFSFVLDRNNLDTARNSFGNPGFGAAFGPGFFGLDFAQNHRLT